MKTQSDQKQPKENPESNVLQKKPSWLKKLVTSNGFSLGFKSVFTGLGIFLAISSGGILLIAGAALATTILVSSVGKTLVDAQVLRNHEKLNKQIEAAQELQEARKAYDALSPEQKNKIKDFLQLPENKELAGLNEFLKEKTNTENNPLSTLKAHSRLATFDKVNNIVRSVLGFAKALLLLPLIIFQGIAAVPDVIKSAMSALKVAIGIKTIKTRDERHDIVSGGDKTKQINELLDGKTLDSYEPNDIAKTAQQLQILTELASKDNNEISPQDFKKHVKIELKRIEGNQTNKQYTTREGFWEILWIALKGKNSTKFQNMVGNSRTDQDKRNQLV